MVLQIEYKEQRFAVEIGGKKDAERIMLDGEAVECDWVKMGEGRYSLILQDRSYDLTAEVSGEVCVVQGAEGSLDLRIVDPRSFISERPIEDDRKGLQRILAEMPGKVIRILVQRGQEVSFEQGLLIIEAMKMQNEVRAPQSGVIREIGVEEGKAVATGDFLLSIE
jgi:biotin carboxyl carrier protein